MWQSYYTADRIETALELLARFGKRARIVAGATDLMLELEQEVRPEVEILIDVTRIPKQDLIWQDEAGWIHLGPMVTHNHCAGSQLIQEQAFALARACWEVGAPQIRNRGTIAGNLITASPANDSITPLMALGAQVRLRSSEAERVVPLENFYTGVRQTVMQDQEMLIDISFPAPPASSRSTFIKLGLRRAQAISVINVALLATWAEDEIQSATLTLGSVAPTIIHASKAEAYLQGQQLTPDVITQAASLAAEAAKPINDLRGSAAYRQEMGAGLRTTRLTRSGFGQGATGCS